MGTALIFLGLLVFSAHLFSMIFSKKKIPDVLLLLIIGVLIGPVLNLVTPEDFGSMGSVFERIVAFNNQTHRQQFSFCCSDC